MAHKCPHCRSITLPLPQTGGGGEAVLLHPDAHTLQLQLPLRASPPVLYSADSHSGCSTVYTTQHVYTDILSTHRPLCSTLDQGLSGPLVGSHKPSKVLIIIVPISGDLGSWMAPEWPPALCIPCIGSGHSLHRHVWGPYTDHRSQALLSPPLLDLTCPCWPSWLGCPVCCWRILYVPSALCRE